MNEGGLHEHQDEFKVESEKNGYQIYADAFADSPHKPVMAREVLRFVPENRELKVIDATVGCGGHSSLILKNFSGAVLLGLDRDRRALEFAERRLSFAGGRFRLMLSRFSEIKSCAAEMGWLSVDMILMDLGVSSLQLDDPARGFSYSQNGPLDMRMGEAGISATEILNGCSREELAEIFGKYGELRRPGKLADEILKEREFKRLESTQQLAEICRRIPGLSRKMGPAAPTLCFQAIRIAVNEELQEVERGLKDAVGLLSSGGRIVVISFNSLEDRIVKNYFRTEASGCLCPPEFFQCACGHKKTLKILTKKPMIAQTDESETNRRAAPAKLRAAEKI